jgi:hypothetical protein
VKLTHDYWLTAEEASAAVVRTYSGEGAKEPGCCQAAEFDALVEVTRQIGGMQEAVRELIRLDRYDERQNRQH